MSRFKIRAGNKYTTQERIKARRIHDLKTQQSKYFNLWHEIDAKINRIKLELNGKYITKR